MRPNRLRLFGAAMLALVCALLLNAQDNRATVLGTVTDPTGAVVPRARVTAISGASVLGNVVRRREWVAGPATASAPAN